MKMTVTGLPRGADPREARVLAEIEFAPAPDGPDSMGFSEVGVRVNEGAELHFSGAYYVPNRNVSLFVLEGQVHVFTGMSHWDRVAPYFAFRLRDGTFIQMTFEKQA
jgi:hypothetical protein